MNRRWRTPLLLWLAGFVVLTVGFQNCARPQAGASSSASDAGLETANGNGDPGDANAAARTLEKTMFYFGRSTAIDVLEIDHAAGTFTSKTSVAFQGQVAGWLVYDERSKTVFAADAGSSGKIERYGLSSTGELVSKGIQAFLSSIVHLTIAPMSSGFEIFGANYDEGRLGLQFLGVDQTPIGSTQSFDFGGSAKIHSTAFDPSRRLLFVAALGLNQILVFQMTEAAPRKIGEITIANPRTVVYDSIYDKLYVSTEASSGTSFIKGYAISQNGSGYDFKEVASQTMSLIGADLKVNHKNRYVMATSREVGRQAINGMPVTTTGEQDLSRAAFRLPLTQIQPRSLEITDDGGYAVVAMNSFDTQNVVAFKMNFDDRLRFLSAEKVFERKIANEGYLCSLSVPLYKESP